MLTRLIRRLVESALEGELTDHLGFERHDAAGRVGGNSQSGHRTKTVLIRGGQVTNGPIYVVLAVTRHGHRNILGLWAGDGREGAKYWLHVPHRAEEPWRQ